MRLMHGTSTRFIKEIELNGLTSPDLTNNREVAEFFAEETSQASGGDPVIITTEVRDLGRLRADEHMWRDPPPLVLELHGASDQNEWQEKISMREIPRPKNNKDYAASLAGVFAASYKGVIPPEDIVGVEDVEVFEDD